MMRVLFLLALAVEFFMMGVSLTSPAMGAGFIDRNCQINGHVTAIWSLMCLNVQLCYIILTCTITNVRTPLITHTSHFNKGTVWSTNVT